MVPCNAMEPVSDRAKPGIMENLEAATRWLKSSLCRTYSKVLDTVDFMFAFLRGDEQTDVVPFADRLGGIECFAGLRINGGLIQRHKAIRTAPGLPPTGLSSS